MLQLTLSLRNHASKVVNFDSLVEELVVANVDIGVVVCVLPSLIIRSGGRALRLPPDNDARGQRESACSATTHLKKGPSGRSYSDVSHSQDNLLSHSDSVHRTLSPDQFTTGVNTNRSKFSRCFKEKLY